MDSSETPEPASSVAAPFPTPSCDLLSHTVCRSEALLPESQEHRGRLNLSDRKLSLQERSHSAASPCSSPGLNGRYIYPSLPYSPITSPHSSPRLPRRPTVESHSVSITDLQVWSGLEGYIIPVLGIWNFLKPSLRFILLFAMCRSMSGTKSVLLTRNNTVTAVCYIDISTLL